MKYAWLCGLLLACHLTACAQQPRPVAATDKQVGGNCEGCEAVHESPLPFDQLTAAITLPDYDTPGPKLHISGTVYKADGRTPAPGVVLYIYHTNQQGIYPQRGNEKDWARRHGYIRGWIKTNEKGIYEIRTLRPGSYPQGRNPAHIHAIIKEPGKSAYWIDDFLFADDPFLTTQQRGYLRDRGGNGILQTVKEGDILVARRDIILGRNVENYE